MKRAYLFLLIGIIFAHLHLNINNFDLLHDTIGYFLIFFGIVNLEREHSSSTLKKAELIASILLMIQMTSFIISPLLLQHPSTLFLFNSLLVISQFILYELILYSQRKQTDTPFLRNLEKRYLLLGGAYLIFYFLASFIAEITLLLLVSAFLYITYLIVAFYKLYKLN